MVFFYIWIIDKSDKIFFFTKNENSIFEINNNQLGMYSLSVLN